MLKFFWPSRVNLFIHIFRSWPYIAMFSWCSNYSTSQSILISLSQFLTILCFTLQNLQSQNTTVFIYYFLDFKIDRFFALILNQFVWSIQNALSLKPVKHWEKRSKFIYLPVHAVENLYFCLMHLLFQNWVSRLSLTKNALFY